MRVKARYRHRAVMIACIVLLAFSAVPAHAEAAAQASLVRGQQVQGQSRLADFALAVQNQEIPITGRAIRRVRFHAPSGVRPVASLALPPPGWEASSNSFSIEFSGLPGGSIPPQEAQWFEFPAEIGGGPGGDWEVLVWFELNLAAPASTATVAPGGTLTTTIHPVNPLSAQASLMKGEHVSAGASVEFSIRVQNTEPLPSKEACATGSTVVLPCVAGRWIDWISLELPCGMAKVCLNEEDIVPPPGWTVAKWVSGSHSHHLRFRAPSRSESPACATPQQPALCRNLPPHGAIPPHGELTFEFTATVESSCCGNTLVGDWFVSVSSNDGKSATLAAVAPGGTLTTTNHP